MIIGVYGRIGSGKSTLCRYLEEKGFVSIDGDRISREILLPGKKGLAEVVKVFGTQYLMPDGTLNRKMLGDYVFSNREALLLLNSITHPLITEEIRYLLEKNIKKNIVIEGAVLYATSVIDLCDKTVLVKSSNTLSRIMARDSLSREAAQTRIDAQDFYEKADIILENNGAISEFYDKIDKMLQTISVR